VRNLALEARQLIDGVLRRRRSIAKAAMKAGEPLPVYHDMLAWIEGEAAGKPYNPAAVQLAVSMASTYTTTDLVQQVIIDIATHQEVFAPLRGEVARIIEFQGFSQSACRSSMDSFAQLTRT
jgi:hypothetical protein